MEVHFKKERKKKQNKMIHQGATWRPLVLSSEASTTQSDSRGSQSRVKRRNKRWRWGWSEEKGGIVAEVEGRVLGLALSMRAQSVSHSWLCNPLDSSPPGSSVYGVFQARILEWVATPSSRGSSWPREWTLVSCFGFFTMVPPGKSF